MFLCQRLGGMILERSLLAQLCPLRRLKKTQESLASKVKQLVLVILTIHFFVHLVLASHVVDDNRAEIDVSDVKVLFLVQLSPDIRQTTA